METNGAVIWENEDGSGWWVSCPGKGKPYGPFAYEQDACSAAGRLGYEKGYLVLCPPLRGNLPFIADYSGKIINELEEEEYWDWAYCDLSSSHLVSARSDDEAITAALGECSDYLHEWRGEFGPDVGTPPVYAKIEAKQRSDGAVRHIYARPAGRDGPATAFYIDPPYVTRCISRSMSGFRASVFTDNPDSDVLRRTAHYWSRFNSGNRPPVEIRSGEGLGNRMRALRRNTADQALSL